MKRLYGGAWCRECEHTHKVGKYRERGQGGACGRCPCPERLTPVLLQREQEAA